MRPAATIRARQRGRVRLATDLLHDFRGFSHVAEAGAVGGCSTPCSPRSGIPATARVNGGSARRAPPSTGSTSCAVPLRAAAAEERTGWFAQTWTVVVRGGPAAAGGRLYS